MRIHELTENLASTIAKGAPRVVNQTARDIDTFFNSMGAGVSQSVIRRSGMLALQGRTQEAEQLIRTSLRSADPAKLQKVLAFINTVKPIPNATTAKLDASAPVADWLDNKYLPYVMQYIK